MSLDIKRMLEQEAARVKPAPDLEARVMARARPRRRIAAVVGGLLVLFLLSAMPLTWSLWPSPAKTIAPASNYSTYRDGQKGWSLQYPANWHVQPYDDTIGGRFHQRGVLVSNVDLTFSHPGCETSCSSSAWDMNGLPDGGVVVNFEFHAGGIVYAHAQTDHPDTRFPLDLKDLHPVRLGPEDGTPGVLTRQRYIWVDGTNSYTAWMYSHPRVSGPAMNAARHVIASITKPGPDVVTKDLHQLGWSLTYPSAWSLRTYLVTESTGSCCFFIVSNKRVVTREPQCAPSNVPADTVCLGMEERVLPGVRPSGSHVPLGVNQLQGSETHTEGRFTIKQIPLKVNKHQYVLNIYKGNKASPMDIARLKSIAFSIKRLDH